MSGSWLWLLFIAGVAILVIYLRVKERSDRNQLVQQDGLSLDEIIRRYVADGYRIQFRSETSAQLIKPKRFSFEYALLWFLLFGVGLIVYLLYYAGKTDTTVYLEKAADGSVLTR